MKEGHIIGLGLESSCDETSASIVMEGRNILSNMINSQIELHSDFSGVVPEIASRAHLENINQLIDSALNEAQVAFRDLDYVAATNRPGLIGSLLIALQSAKAISFTLNIPLIAVNHLEAHLYAPFLEGREPEFPFIGLLISGGNTALYRVDAPAEMTLIGKTVDDAVGEAYDKVSKYLGLGYPGGPVIEKIARQAVNKKVFFPKILTDPEDRRFSYSGLKTAVINHIKANPDDAVPEIVYSFQERALELLTRRLFKAARTEGIKRMVIAGGVAANGRLREILNNEKKPDEKIIIPSPILCTDNGAMIAGMGYHYFKRGIFDPLSTDVTAKV
ncbi:MAG TPA: tRNA (adenosine(37)-N6)-threonylcarbamoyltransferase complex transferase subunit TsaD [Spirochaetota bacterium]|nr:tRNA (adenosine(37)-N6)-threonylcarbamoyltransferase complex transferase subunit TsaD [Spirochaetota bacterium]HPJ35963.1 tRNA (adenosine(37)-N6)-threonylcarbamoyltransferase complex transferase subunit TsaD [Spirochaetota bacterium]